MEDILGLLNIASIQYTCLLALSLFLWISPFFFQCNNWNPFHRLGHLYVKSDVYGFGVVLLEMLSGQRALDTNRPSGQHNLVDWAKPYLADRRKLSRLMDPRLEGQYPSKGALQAAHLTLRCLAGDPKSRPSMKEVVETLEQIEAMKGRSRVSKDAPQQPPAHNHGQIPAQPRSPLQARRDVVGSGMRAKHDPPRVQ